MNNNQFGRSILTNSFLARIVQMRRYFLTMCTKPLHKEKNIKQMSCSNQEKGRSMVEMLGVLAIIGVLSVGAIAGYSKAMMKYKLNKQAQQISQIISAGLRYAGKWNVKQETRTIQHFQQLGEIPKEMIRSDDSQNVYDIFGTRIYIFTTDDASTIFFHIPNQDDQHTLEICRNITNVAKEYAPDLLSLAAISGTEDTYDTGIFYRGDKYCTSTNCIRNLTLEKIDKFCKNNIGNKYQPHIKVVYPESSQIKVGSPNL